MSYGFRWSGIALGLAAAAGCSDPGAGTFGAAEQPLIGGMPDTISRGVLGLVSDTGGCTGSLIAPNLVLTARHCVASLTNSNGSVNCDTTRFGGLMAPSSIVATWDDNIRNGVPASSVFDVIEVRATSGNAVCGNDVALMILATNVSTATAPLVEPRVNEAPRLNEAFAAVGYGITNPNDAQGSTFGERLRVNGLSVACVGASCGPGVEGTEWAAITPVCSGDSGGPALDSAGRVIGVASRGDESCEAAVYGSVSSFRALIIDTALDAADSGGYSPPGWTGVEVDGGAPDSGEPDSGEPDAGDPDPPDAGDPDPPDAGGPTDPPLGEPCTGSCRDGYACYTPEGQARGICVPGCEPGDACPDNYQCSTRLAVCVPAALPPGPDDGNDDDDDDDGGSSAGCACRAAPGGSGGGAGLGVSLMLAALVRRRRR